MVLKVYRRDCKNPHVIHKQSNIQLWQDNPHRFLIVQSNCSLAKWFYVYLHHLFLFKVSIATATDAPHIIYIISRKGI